MSDYEVLEVAIEGEAIIMCHICKANFAEIEFKNKMICKHCYFDIIEMSDN